MLYEDLSQEEFGHGLKKELLQWEEFSYQELFSQKK